MKFKYLLLVVLLFVSVRSIAQTETEIDSSTAALAVDLTQISKEIETSRLVLKEYQATDFDDAVIKNYDSLIILKSKIIANDFERIEKVNLWTISKVSLDGLISSWSLHKQEISSGFETIRGLFEKTHVELDGIRELIKKWKATAEVLEASDSPKEIQENVKLLLMDLETAKTRLKFNLSELTLLETSISDVDALVKEVDHRFEVALEERSKAIFKQNLPVIWKLDAFTNDTIARDSAEIALNKADSEKSFFNHLSPWSTQKIKVSKDFIESNQNEIYFHIILWILTVLLSLKFGRKVKGETLPKSPTFPQIAFEEVRNELFLTATFISILYAILLYEFIPILISEILGLLLIFLTLLIFRKSKGKQLVKLSILMALLFVAGQVNVENWFPTIGYRLFIFAKLLWGIWVLKLLAHFFTTASSADSLFLLKGLKKGTYVVYGMVLIATIANVLGFVKLANLTTLLVIQTLVVSYIFYGILVTSNGLVSLFFRVAWVPKKAKSLHFRSTIEKMVLRIVNLFATFFWIKSILSTVGIYVTVKEFIITAFTKEVEVGSVAVSLEQIFYFLIVIILTFSVTKFIRVVVSDGGLDRFRLERGVPNVISLVVRYTLIILGVLLAMSMAGIDLSSFSLMAGALGIGIGFGLQNIISNFVSGLILVFERPLQEGDVVEVSGLLGTVKNIGVRSSSIRTFTGSEVIVPNESLISKELINWTLSDLNKRIEIKVGVDYGSNPRQIIELLAEAAKANENVKTDPAPLVLFEEFGDSSLNFRMLFWVPQPMSLSVHSDVMLRVSDTLRAHNINIPFPIRTLKVEREDTQEFLSHVTPSENLEPEIKVEKKPVVKKTAKKPAVKKKEDNSDKK